VVSADPSNEGACSLYSLVESLLLLLVSQALNDEFELTNPNQLRHLDDSITPGAEQQKGQKAAQ